MGEVLVIARSVSVTEKIAFIKFPPLAHLSKCDPHGKSVNACEPNQLSNSACVSNAIHTDFTDRKELIKHTNGSARDTTYLFQL